jgi:hypothetical protein
MKNTQTLKKGVSETTDESKTETLEIVLLDKFVEIHPEKQQLVKL